MTALIITACCMSTLALAALGLIAAHIEPHLDALWSVLGLGDDDTP